MNRIGSLCTGYGGLDIAVENVLGGQMVWYSEFEKHPSALLAQRFPDVPNIGDLTEVPWDNWKLLLDVDILTGGYPCQPFSNAGKRLGEHDPRHLWPHIREAIRVLRPRLTFLENVAGHRSKGFSEVLRDCAEDGLDVRWVSVRASDVGAPHQRERLFFVVTDPSRSDVREYPGESSSEEARTYSGDGPEDHHGIRAARDRGQALSYPERLGRGGVSLPECGPGDEGSSRPSERGEVAAYAVEYVAGGLPVRVESEKPRPESCDLPLPTSWGEYEPAIRRWEQVLGRPAPAPTEPNKNGKPRLTVAFDEWMMGLPEGWINDIDIPYGAKIKLCGNGVVPQQAELALRLLLDIERDEHAPLLSD